MAATDVFRGSAGFLALSVCVVFAVMREPRIPDAFTTDHHFELAGFVPLLKPD